MALGSRRYANERLFVLAGLAAASVVCVGLVFLRELVYHADDFRFLVWNLVLAWVPLLLALLVYDRYGRGTPLARLAPLILTWLLFLPNAPYILTDFVHLSAAGDVSLWFDGATLSAFACTGLLLGFASLYLTHLIARDRLGNFAAWCCVTIVLAVVSVGVCLGRFLRWNSWDPITSPGHHAAELVDAIDRASLVPGAMIVFLLTCVLSAGYFSFYAVARGRLARGEWLSALDAEVDAR